MIASVAILTSCSNIFSNDTPKCDDPEVTGTVIAIIKDQSNSFYTSSGAKVIINNEDSEITNVMTKSNDKELKLCGCEGTFEGIPYIGNIIYSAQKNSEGEVIVKIEEAGPFEYKFQ